jgi:hypothetical protein
MGSSENWLKCESKYTSLWRVSADLIGDPQRGFRNCILNPAGVFLVFQVCPISSGNSYHFPEVQGPDNRVLRHPEVALVLVPQ